ncbi:MAG: ATP-binding protein [Anaerolineae bacterium]|nr:ATP-binding protein [Anaerolineae bacterium]
MSEITIYFPPVSLDDLAEIRRLIESAVACLWEPGEAVNELVVAINEAVTNVLVHGYQGQPGQMVVKVSRDNATLMVRLHDQAWPFDPTAVPPPDITLPLSQRQPGGMGVHLMRQFCHQIQHQVRPEGGNELKLVKLIEP